MPTAQVFERNERLRIGDTLETGSIQPGQPQKLAWLQTRPPELCAQVRSCLAWVFPARAWEPGMGANASRLPQTVHNALRRYHR
jgi:hypothetical protein